MKIPLEEERATPSSILVWEIPRTEEAGGHGPWGHNESDGIEGTEQAHIERKEEESEEGETQEHKESMSAIVYESCARISFRDLSLRLRLHSRNGFFNRRVKHKIHTDEMPCLA